MANILGIKFSNLSLADTIKAINFDIENKKQVYAVTPNPEIVLASLKDEELANILNSAKYSLADGIGIKLAGLLRSQRISRLTGADLTLAVLNLARLEKYRVAIVIWSKGLSSSLEIKLALENKYPGLEFLILENEREAKLGDENILKINNFNPQILFVALGAPEQEKLISNHLGELENVNFAIGVGGSFDFISKRAKRAPKLFRYLGLEWLWRLITQPKRLPRIWQATFVFAYKALRYKEGRS